MNESDIYQKILSIFYPIFFVSTITVQILLLYLIIFHSPKALQSIRLILINTSIVQIILCTVCCFSQYRMITTQVPVVLRSYGYCRHYPAHICFILYEVLQTTSFTGGMSIVITFYFKYRIIKMTFLTTSHMLKSFALFHIPVMISILSETYMVFDQSLPSEIVQEYQVKNVGYTDYIEIGVLKLKSIPSAINFIIISGSVFVLPPLSLYFRNQIMKHINSRISSKRQQISQRFLSGLTIQAILPILFYVPLFSLYLYCIITKEEVLFQQYMMTVISSLPALIDPILAIFFITPYRNRITSWIKKKPNDDSRVFTRT
ncbi:unnamed protein product [Caenorhabditis angaria]|uniref:G-protein coupled receptors family 1 profile domain-containing protein n=1 Tax=Caenorhabditis angaria TaxID=860376 RepID=A0A9P1N4Y2_9PELO|nr:unnamed protein product [Caenorhabditis angaria]